MGKGKLSSHLPQEARVESKGLSIYHAADAVFTQPEASRHHHHVATMEGLECKATQRRGALQPHLEGLSDPRADVGKSRASRVRKAASRGSGAMASCEWLGLPVNF